MAAINERIETIAVVDKDHPLGYRIINKDQFDPKVHKEYKGKFYNSEDEVKKPDQKKG